MNWLERAIVAEEILVEAGGKNRMNKNLRQFIKRYLKPAGWEVRRKSGRGHQWETTCPCGRHLYTLPSTPSDNRGFENLRSTLRNLCPSSGL